MTNNKITKGICILLTLVLMLGMITGAVPTLAEISDEHLGLVGEVEPIAIWDEVEHHYTHELQFGRELFDYRFFEELYAYEEVYISESRRNFLYLMESGYNNHQLRQRFRELFGTDYSGEYIFHNYRRIFDLEDGEEINSAFLRVLSGYRVDFRFQDNGIRGAEALVLDLDGVTVDNAGRVLVFPDSETAFVPFGDEMPGWAVLNMPEPEIPDVIVNDRTYFEADIDAQMIQPLSTVSATVSLFSRANTSVMVDVWFSINNYSNAFVQVWSHGQNAARFIRGGGQPAPTNGRLNIPGLSPGVTYWVSVGIRDRVTGQWIINQIPVTTTAPAEHLIFNSRSSVDFRLDRLFLDTLGPVLSARFMDATNQAFYVIRDFVGGAQHYTGGRMELRHTRNLPRHVEGWSGWPMLWQLTNMHDAGVLVSIDHAHRMRATNIDTTEMPIHEIGHNFDNFRWSFETEAFAVFFTYYYYRTTNRHMANAQDARTFMGSEFRTYMRSYAQRFLGQINHNEAIRQNVYSPYSMAYFLANIMGQIGRQPFVNTFLFFHNMHYHELPNTDLEQLNLFLTRLRHYSGGRDVIGMMPCHTTRTIFERFFGGRIEYLQPPVRATITNPASDNQVVPRQAFNITWGAVPGATRYVVSVRNLTTNALLAENRVVNGTSFAIPLNWLVHGNQYRIAVGTVRAGQTIWSIRYFTVESAAPVARTIEISLSQDSVVIPTTGTTQVSATVTVRDQFGNEMPNINPTLSISPPRAGVSVVSSTRVITIDSNAAPGTATIRAAIGALAATASLELTREAGAPTPGVPLRPDALNITQTGVTIIWRAVPGANTYRLYKNGVLYDGELAVLSRRVDNLTPGMTYTFTVRAVNALGVASAHSLALTVTTLLGTGRFTITYINTHTTGAGGLPVTGSLPLSQTNLTIGDSVNLANNSRNLQRPGFILLGWSTAANRHRPDPEFTLGHRGVNFGNQGNIRLYAHWGSLGWWNQPVVNVDVQLYADRLFDREIYDSESHYLGSINVIANRAATAFDSTFGINMNISSASNTIWVESLKNECNDHVNMVRPRFLCRTAGCCPDLPDGVPRHSNGPHMLNYALTTSIPPSNRYRGLHTMFFAGEVCRGVREYLGMADPDGNRSINSSSAFDATFYDWRRDRIPVGVGNNLALSVRILQHEWSHNYNARDNNDCRTHCIMDGGSWMYVPQGLNNLWCTRCRNIITSNRRNH